MKSFGSIFIVSLLSVVSVGPTLAINIVECQDKQGNRSFSSSCPPDTVQLNQKKLHSLGSAKNEEPSQAAISATLYRVPECDACDEIKDFLTLRNIAFTEKNVEENIPVQEELAELTDELVVPITVIGKEVISGYNRSKLLSILEAAGYQESSNDSN